MSLTCGRLVASPLGKTVLSGGVWESKTPVVVARCAWESGNGVLVFHFSIRSPGVVGIGESCRSCGLHTALKRVQNLRACENVDDPELIDWRLPRADRPAFYSSIATGT